MKVLVVLAVLCLLGVYGMIFILMNCLRWIKTFFYLNAPLR